MSLTAALPNAARLRSAVAAHPYRLAAAGVALVAGLAVFVLAHQLFPYLSSNHDEGVYLQQAAMLIDGRLFLQPGSAVLRDAVHPWFFVEGPQGLYPRYTPVPAAVFALGKLAGGYRLALGGVAVANVGLTYAVASAAFDRRTGLLAAATLALAPMFLVTSSTFLSYAPTTALNLAFAAAYVRSVRRSSLGYAVLAGAAIGLAFFARPLTAVLFALPFVGHAGWRLAREGRHDRALLARTAATATVGSAFVGLALGYNAVVTGSALLFPYEAFAPRDGLGFGRRALLGYERDYTPAVALRANAAVLWRFARDWFTAGLLGTAAAGIGVVVAAVDVRRRGFGRADPLSDRQLRAVLLGVGLSVVAGNVLFWGNLNILGGPTAAGDGFIDRFGPFYHFDLLVPMAAFAAHGVVTVGDRIRRRAAADDGPTRLAVALLVIASAGVAGAAEADALGPAVERNAAHTQKYDRAYAPFQAADRTDALVFLPPAFGPWLNHPLQWLRNEPGFDGPTVYALDRSAASDFAVMVAYPDRTYYRYRYHGTWTADPDDRVIPVLERVRVVDGRVVRARTTVAVPAHVVALSVALSAADAVRRYDFVGEIPRSVTLDWTVRPSGASVAHPDLVAAGNQPSMPVTRPETVALTVTLTEPGGGTLTYREELAVRPTSGGIEVVWPPATSVCPLVTDCGLAGTYVPDRPATRPSGIETTTALLEPSPGANSTDPDGDRHP